MLITTIAKLRQYLDINAILSHFQNKVPLGNKLLCPFHEETKPSFFTYTNQDAQKFKCFGCGVSGDAIDLLKLFLNTTENSNVFEYLLANNDLLDHELDLKDLTKNYHEEIKTRTFWNKAWKWCQEQLLTSKADDLRNWLVERGLHSTLLDKLPLGYFDYPSFKTTFDKETDEYNIFPSKISNKPCVVFPYYSDFDTLSRLKLRTVRGSSGDTTFLGQDLGSPGFYGLNLLKYEDIESLMLVEGEFDCLLPHNLSFLFNNQYTNVISRSGAAALNEEAIGKLFQMGTKRISVFPDNDEGGFKFIIGICKLSQVTRFNIIWPDDYKENEDPADYCKRFTSFEPLRDKLSQSSQNIAKFLGNYHIAQYKQKSVPSEDDFNNLRVALAKAGSETQLSGFALNDFVQNVATQMPSITAESLRCEITKAKVSNVKTIEIGDKVFQKGPDGYYEKKFSRKEERVIKIANVLVEISKVIRFEGHSPRYEAYIVAGHREVPVVLCEEDLKDFKSFTRKVDQVAPGYIVYDPSFEKSYRSIINALNYPIQEVKGVNVIGWNGNKFIYPKFIVENGEITPNNDVYICHESLISSFYDVPLIEDRKELLKTRDLITEKLFNLYRHPLITYVLLGHIAAAPFIDRLKLKPGALFVEGQYRAGKTTLIQIFLNLFAKYPVRGGSVSPFSTVNYILKTLSYMAGVPVFIDDIKSQLIKDPTQFNSMIQNYHDRQGRGRMNQRLELQHQDIIKGSLIMCGEDLPTREASTLSRIIKLRLVNACYNVDAVEEIIPDVERLGYLLPYYIAWLQKNTLRRIIVSEKYKYHRSGLLIDELGTGLFYFLKFLVDDMELAPEVMTKHWDLFKQHSEELTETNVTNVEEENEGDLFVRSVEQLIHGDMVTLSDEPTSKTKIGRYDGEDVIIFPDIAIKKVEEIAKRSFIRMSLYNTLIERELLNEKKSSPTKVWALRRDKLFSRLGEPSGVTINDRMRLNLGMS